MLPRSEMDNNTHTKITNFQPGEKQQPTKPQPSNQQSVNTSLLWCITSQAAKVLTEAFDADNSLLQLQSCWDNPGSTHVLTHLQLGFTAESQGEWTVTKPCVKGLGSQAGIYWCSSSTPQPGTQRDEQEGENLQVKAQGGAAACNSAKRRLLSSLFLTMSFGSQL